MTVSAMMLTGLLKASVATTSASSGQKLLTSAIEERAAVDSTYMSSSIARWPSAESATAAQTLPARPQQGPSKSSSCHSVGVNPDVECQNAASQTGHSRGQSAWARALQ